MYGKVLKSLISDPKSNSTQDSGFHSSDSFSLSLLWCRWKQCDDNHR